jgi:polyphosphate glucokinase
MKVLVIDIGGTHVKLYATDRSEPLKIDSGPMMTPMELVEAVKTNTRGWKYDVISIGYPGPVVHGKPLNDPANLGKGWLGFDFEKAFGRPVKIINDAAMQALGSYRGGSMLFLGLGTGFGAALVVDGVLEPMELAHLHYKHGKTFEEFVGTSALKRVGEEKWTKNVFDIVEQLKNALRPEYVVLGGGNSLRLKTLPPETIRGNNEDARKGGLRLWDRSRRGYTFANY